MRTSDQIDQGQRRLQGINLLRFEHVTDIETYLRGMLVFISGGPEPDGNCRNGGIWAAREI